MYKRKALIILLIISVLTNLYLFYNLKEVQKNQQNMEVGMLSRANRAIDSVVNNIGKLVNEWDETSDSRKIQYLGEVDKDLSIAMHSMNDSGNFFLPIKLFRNGIYSMEQKIGLSALI